MHGDVPHTLLILVVRTELETYAVVIQGLLVLWIRRRWPYRVPGHGFEVNMNVQEGT